MADVQKVAFGQHLVNPTQVFYRSKYCLGLVNLMPVVKGHVMVIPKRKVLRYKDLSKDEITEMFVAAQDISKVLEKEFEASSMTFAIQDGAEAGQTVWHTHLHCIPRKGGDFPNNDDIYVEIEKKERKRRTEDEMAQEAERLAAHFPDNKNFSLTE